MDIPTPRLLPLNSFYDEIACDEIPDEIHYDETLYEEHELALLKQIEEANKNWLDFIGKKHTNPVPLEKQNPPPPPPGEPEADNAEFIAPRNEESIVIPDESNEMVETDESPDSEPPPEYVEQWENTYQGRSTPDSEAFALILNYMPYYVPEE